MKKIRFLFFILGQFLILLALSINYYVLDDYGEIIQLKTTPFDPQDMFYGDYVNLRYEIESVPAGKWQGSLEPESNVKVYVLLEPGEDGVYELVSAGETRIEPLENQVVLTGSLEYHDDFNDVYELDFGLSRYFIEDNTGERFDNQTTPLTVTVAVSGWGPNKILSVE